VTIPPQCLIDKAEVLRRVPVTFVTLWTWMRQGNFPLSRNIGGKSAWLEAEVEAWINARPVNKFKDEDQPLKPPPVDHPHPRQKSVTETKTQADGGSSVDAFNLQMRSGGNRGSM
jgi:predicted DNA-binding transcriptional regulator AlpA